MKRRKIFVMITAAFLAAAPLSLPIANEQGTSLVQAADDHQSYIKHTANWNIEYTWNKNKHNWNKMYLRSSPMWQNKFKKYIADDTGYNRSYNYKDPHILAELKKGDSIPFAHNHAAICIEPGFSHLFVKDVKRATHMWAPEFHFTITDNPREANLFIVERRLPAKSHADAAEIDAVKQPQKRKVIIIDLRATQKDGYDAKGMIYLLAHEIGHAIGLPHDQDIHSVMADDQTPYDPLTAKELKHWQPSRVTAANRHLVAEIYHEKRR